MFKALLAYAVIGITAGLITGYLLMPDRMDDETEIEAYQPLS